MDSFRCLKRAEPATVDRVIRATFLGRNKLKLALLYDLIHATPSETILSRDFDGVVEILMVWGSPMMG